jgi:hypothetical protein
MRARTRRDEPPKMRIHARRIGIEAGEELECAAAWPTFM